LFYHLCSLMVRKKITEYFAVRWIIAIFAR